MVKISSSPLILSFVLFAQFAQSEVILIAETGFIVENKVHIDKPVEATWQAFVREVGKWWPRSHTWWGEGSKLSIQAEAGGCFCETEGQNSAEHMRVVFVEPYKLLRMTGGLGPLQGMGMYGALDWSFTDSDQGTTVTMTYKVNGINPGGFSKLAPIVDQVQALQVGGLAKFLGN